MPYKENVQPWVVPKTGYYKIELWGAQGGDGTTTYPGANGGYTQGKIRLIEGELYYIYIGGAGASNCTSTTCSGGYNGGGNSGTHSTVIEGGGGGATDIRYFGADIPDSSELVSTSNLGLNSRIMVAGGGGAGAKYGTSWYGPGASGGNLIGSNATSPTAIYPGYGGTQIAGGAVQNCVVGQFGLGGTRATSAAGGGGGYYGASCGWGAGGGGGSSYMSGYAGSISITTANLTNNPRSNTMNTLHYSGKYFVDGGMESGVRTGNGQAIITYLGATLERQNANFDNVRYIKDCIDSYTTNGDNTWVEIQAIYKGLNVAKGKTVTGNYPQNNSYPYSRITDGNIAYAAYSYSSTYGNDRCVTVDLERKYDLDEIAVWHYWGDGRNYANKVTMVSEDGNNWVPVMMPTTAETQNGFRVTAQETNSFLNIASIYYYKNSAQIFEAQKNGKYKFELWGAQGGSTTTAAGGKGAYTTGEINLTANEKLYIYVGGKGFSTSASVAALTAGQACCSRQYGSGGGATDVRYFSIRPSNNDLLYNSDIGINSRIMVAGGGGGAYSGSNDVTAANAGGAGGTIHGIQGSQSGGGANTYCYGLGGTQVSGGAITTNCGQTATYNGIITGTFLLGGTSSATSTGGGGGYYGGSISGHIASAGGGSSYISGYKGCVAITEQTIPGGNRTPRISNGAQCTEASATNDTTCSYHYSGKIFDEAIIKSGDESMPSRFNTTTITGNMGDGFVKITYVES